MSKLGKYFRVDDLTGMQLTQSVGDLALHPTCMDGTTMEVQSLSTGKKVARVVPLGINVASLAREAGRWVGGTLTASDVDPGGIFKIQNTTGLALHLSHFFVEVQTVPAGACTLDIGVTVDPIPAGGSNGLFDGIDIRSGGTPRAFDSRWPGDHPASGKIGGTWANNSWLSGTVASGASAGLVGYWAVYVIRLDNLLLSL